MLTQKELIDASKCSIKSFCSQCSCIKYCDDNDASYLFNKLAETALYLLNVLVKDMEVGVDFYEIHELFEKMKVE